MGAPTGSHMDSAKDEMTASLSWVLVISRFSGCWPGNTHKLKASAPLTFAVLVVYAIDLSLHSFAIRV